MLQRKADANVVSIIGQTPLSIACERGHAKIIHLLLQQGADLKFQDQEKGNSALHLACQSGCLKSTKAILDFTHKQDQLQQDLLFLENKQGQKALDLVQSLPKSDEIEEIHSILQEKHALFDTKRNEMVQVLIKKEEAKPQTKVAQLDLSNAGRNNKNQKG